MTDNRARGSIHGHIHWDNGRHTDFIYARIVNGEERKADFIELDGERYERVRECKLNPIVRHVDDVACLGFECSLCHMAIYTPGERLVAAFHGFDFCPLCGAKVKAVSDDER